MTQISLREKKKYEICQNHGIALKTRTIEFESRDAAKMWNNTFSYEITFNIAPYIFGYRIFVMS